MKKNHKNLFVAFCFILSFYCYPLSALADTPLNILFIGNSFTNQGPISQVVKDLASNAGWSAPNVTNVSVNGQSLQYHRNRAATLAAIDQGGWNFVVLQEYSTKATDNAGSPSGFKADATYLYDRIKQNSPDAQIVLYQTWARHENHDMYPNTFANRDQMQTQVNSHYHDCVENYIPTHSQSAVKTDLCLAVVGEAWDSNYHGQNMMLHGTDLYHAGSRGQYLNGLVIYSTIYNRSVIGLTPLLGVSQSDALYLQMLSDSVTNIDIPKNNDNNGENVIIGGEIINIDLSNNQTAGFGWNTIGTIDGSVVNAVNDDGVETDISVAITDIFNWHNTNGTTTPSSDLGIPSQATSDSLYGNDVEFSGKTEPTAEILFSNLDPSLFYQFTIFASRMGVDDNREAQYDIVGNEGIIDTLLLDSANNTDTAVTSSFITPTDSGTISIKIQKGPNNNNGYGFYYIGSVSMKIINVFNAVNPSPSIDDEVTADVTLSWEQLEDVAGKGIIYDVYFGTEPNELSSDYYGLNTVKTTTDNPVDFTYIPTTDLTSETTYYWRVDALEPDTSNPGAYIVHTGNEWSFITEPASVRIDTDPADQTVKAGASAFLTIDALNATKYQWYKDGIALADDQTDSQYIGEDSAELKILDFQFEDEGLYHCVVDNNMNQPEESSQAKLLLARQVSWWKFDGDLTDSIGELFDGAESHDIITSNPDPNLVDGGIDGGAYQLFGTEGNHLVVSDSSEFYNFYTQGYTISVWINKGIKTGSNWEAYISKQADGEGFGLFNQSSGAPVMVQRNSVGDLYSNTDIDDNQWHLVTFTYDKETNSGYIYVDGTLKNSVTASGYPAANSGSLLIGLEYADNPTRNLLAGKLDDLRIWSYPLDAFEIGALYTDLVPGVHICVQYPTYDIAGPDGVGAEYRDCKVDMFDLVPMAQAWLQCNIVPTCN